HIHRDELMPFKLQLIADERLPGNKTIEYLAREKLAPKAIKRWRRKLCLHRLDNRRCRYRFRARETLNERCEAKKMIAMSMCDVDRGEVFAACDHPIEQCP